MLKRISFLFVVVMSISMVLAGCGGDALKAKDVLEKAANASKDLENYQAKADMIMKMEANEQTMSMNMTMDSKIQNDPVLAHVTMEMEMQGKTLETVMYMTENDLYMQYPQMSEQWIKVKNPSSQQLSTKNMDPAKNLEILKKYVDEFKMEEKDDVYVLTMTAKGEDVKEFYNEVASEMLPNNQQTQQVMDKMTIEEINYTYQVGKENFYPKKLKMNLKMSLENQGVTTKMDQTMTMTFSNYNKLDELKVPEDVKNNAVERNLNGTGSSN